jgi:hypothetical protein
MGHARSRGAEAPGFFEVIGLPLRTIPRRHLVAVARAFDQQPRDQWPIRLNPYSTMSRGSSSGSGRPTMSQFPA